MKETVDTIEKEKELGDEIKRLHEHYVKEIIVNELEEELNKLARLEMMMKSDDLFIYAQKIEATAAEHGVEDAVLKEGLTNLVELLVRLGYYVEAKSISERYRLI